MNPNDLRALLARMRAERGGGGGGGGDSDDDGPRRRGPPPPPRPPGASGGGGSGSADPADPKAVRKQIKAINTHFEQYQIPVKFKIGDIVKWKPGLENRKMPSKDSVAIVTRVYSEGPAVISTDPASAATTSGTSGVITGPALFDGRMKDVDHAAFYERLDLVLGLIDSDDDFVEYHFDSRRLMLASEDDVAPRLVKRLRDHTQQLLTREPFLPGDVVMWKEGLKNRNIPEKEGIAIVITMLPNPIFDRKKTLGSPYYREPLDLQLGVIDDDGDFVVYHFDSRRFTHAPASLN